MQYKQVDKDYFIYIEKNEKVMDTLTRFCKDQTISNGKISGIGAVKEIEIGAYDTIIKESFDKSKFHIQRGRCKFCPTTFYNIGISMTSINLTKLINPN